MDYIDFDVYLKTVHMLATTNDKNSFHLFDYRRMVERINADQFWIYEFLEE